MSGIEVKLDTEAVEREIVQAIVASALGEKIQTAVNELLSPSYGRSSVIANAVTQAVHEQVRIRCRELIREPGPVHDAIEGKLRAALTEDQLDLIVKGFVTKLGLVTAEDINA